MFNDRLVLLRKRKGLSQYKLAEILNLTRGQVANYEQGKRQPDYETLKMFADFFNVSTDYLLGRSDDPRPQPKQNVLTLPTKLIEVPAKKHKLINKLLDLSEDSQEDMEKFIDIFAQKDKGKNEQSATAE